MVVTEKLKNGRNGGRMMIISFGNIILSFAIAFLCLLVLQAVPVEQVVRGSVCDGARLQELRG